MTNAGKSIVCLLNFILLLSFHFKVMGQQQRIFLDLTQHTVRAGEIVYFQAYILDGLKLSSHGDNLHIEVCSKEGNRFSHQLFRADSGISVGQIAFSDSLPSDNYYVIAYTDAPSLIFTVPVYLYNQAKPNVFYSKQAVHEEGVITSGDIKGIIWISHLQNGHIYSELKCDTLSYSRHLLVQRPDKEGTGIVTAVTLQKDATDIYSLFPIDSTKDVQTLLLYEDSVLIGRQYLGVSDVAASIDVKPSISEKASAAKNQWTIQLPDTSSYFASLTVEDADQSISSPITITSLHNSVTEDLSLPEQRPTIDSSRYFLAWEDNKEIIDPGSLNPADTEFHANEKIKQRILATAIVKGYKDFRKELDHEYTTGAFSEPAAFSYDIRNYVGEIQDLFFFLNTQSGRIRYDPVRDSLKDVLGHPIHYYIDQVQYDAFSLHMYKLSQIAYVKILESSFLAVSKGMDDCSGQNKFLIAKKSMDQTDKSKPNPTSIKINIASDLTPINVLVYTKRGEYPASLGAAVDRQRYSSALPFAPTRRTILWHPLEKIKGFFSLCFDDPYHCRQYRVKISAITMDGKIAYCERVITAQEILAASKPTAPELDDTTNKFGY
jgi:hypothetical protein